jgi:RNA polymerase sigma-70 factor (ECF subfamily)
MRKLAKNTEDLIAGIRQDNIRSFRLLFDDYYPILCLFSSKFIHNRETCKDVAQETLLSYWERRSDFFSSAEVKGFLYTVAHNKCLNLLRHVHVGIDDSNHDASEVDFEAAMIEQETYLMVRRAVDNLPTQMRRIILYSMEGLANKEIALKLEITEGTVHTLKKHAYRKLREHLKGVSLSVLLTLIPLA